MIAPLRETTEPTEQSAQGLTRARRLVAATLLEEQARDASPRDIFRKIWAQWKVWALVTGALAVIAVTVAIWRVWG